jgi:hypothetical protein
MLVAQLYGQWDGIVEITPLATSLLSLGSSASLEVLAAGHRHHQHSC